MTVELNEAGGEAAPIPFVRVLAALLGFALILVGLFYLLRGLDQLPAALRDPDSLKQTVEKWSALLGAPDGDFTFNEQKLKLGPPAAIVCLAGGYIIYVNICIQLIVQGARLAVSMLQRRGS